jgi:hypothetical protein
LIHADAIAEAADAPPPSVSDAVASLPVMRLYVSDPWRDFIGVMRDQALLPPVSETLGLERRIRAAGESAIREIWRRLGIEGNDDALLTQTDLSVEAPRRLPDDAR